MREAKHTQTNASMVCYEGLLRIKELLGHKTILMTMPYAVIAPKKLREECFTVLERRSGRYETKERLPGKLQEFDPAGLLTDLILVLTKRGDERIPGHPRDLSRLLKKLKRLRSEVQKMDL